MKLKQLFLLNKRLYKKFTFILLLTLIPVVVLTLGFMAREDSGFVHVILTCEGENDTVDRMMTEFENSSELILFERNNSVAESLDLLKYGKTDSVWIFPENIEEKLDVFARTRDADEYVVRIVERESSVVLRLVHEKLSGVLFKYISKNLYLNFSRNVPELDAISDEELFEYYDSFETKGSLFDYEYTNKGSEQVGYMLSPVRGILGVLVTLGALAGAMYSMDDEKRGVFLNASVKSRVFIEFISIYVCVINLAVFSSAALALAGLSAGFAREVVSLLLLSVSATLFAMVVKRLVPSIKLIATLSPLLVCVMVAICPVFFDFRATKAVQHIFPVTYYLNGVYNARYFQTTLLYIAVMLLIILVFRIAKNIKEKIR